jgi:hypothetical protein
LTQRKKQRGAPSFLRHNAQRIVSMFKTVRKVTTSRYAFYLLTMSRAGL